WPCPWPPQLRQPSHHQLVRNSNQGVELASIEHVARRPFLHPSRSREIGWGMIPSRSTSCSKSLRRAFECQRVRRLEAHDAPSSATASADRRSRGEGGSAEGRSLYQERCLDMLQAACPVDTSAANLSGPR